MAEHESPSDQGRKARSVRFLSAPDALMVATRKRHDPMRPLLLEPFDEPFEQTGPDLVLADLVLDAVLEVRIVVDFHYDEATLGLLDIYTVKTFPDRPRRPHRNVDQVRRGLIELKGAKAALARGAVRAVLDDLPMPARHAILTHEQWLTPQHADAPIELGRQEFLRQE